MDQINKTAEKERQRIWAEKLIPAPPKGHVR
jgi:hypothetical protein